TTMTIATVTHPLVGYENETVTWVRYLSKGFFQPTIASAYGLGRGWGGIWPFLLAAAVGIVLAALASSRVRLTPAALGWGVLALLAWALFAAIAPTALGIDHQGLLSIVGAGDQTALNLKLHDGARYPLTHLVLIAGAVGLVALAAARLFRNAPSDRRPQQPRHPQEPRAPEPRPASA
ncbi:MAG TPA: hypothetical protein VK761_10275, partial [Solirubrobacteraceae bacterium]|nr:hypothetical protein [Solirubrobacteraceae bacterium]